jgi:hypothetical protein
MSRLGRALATIGAAAVLLLLAVAPSYAGGGLQKCLDQAADHNGEPPTCTQTAGGTWVASWPDDGGIGGPGGAGIPGAFVFVFVLALIAAVGITLWKVSTAQKLARQSGMDPGLATQMTLLSDDGLDATYLASSLRQTSQPAPTPSATSTPPSATSRLEELKGLLDRGLVTQVE